MIKIIEVTELHLPDGVHYTAIWKDTSRIRLPTDEIWDGLLVDIQEVDAKTLIEKSTGRGEVRDLSVVRYLFD